MQPTNISRDRDRESQLVDESERMVLLEIHTSIFLKLNLNAMYKQNDKVRDYLARVSKVN